MYMEDHEQFVSMARFWTETYAVVRSSIDEAVQRLVDMGFPAVMARLLCAPAALALTIECCALTLQDKAKEALEAVQGDENAAIEKLVSSM